MKKPKPVYFIPIMIFLILLILFGRTFGVLFIAANIVFIFLITFLLKSYKKTMKKPRLYIGRSLIVVYGLFLLSFIAVESYLIVESEKSKVIDASEVDVMIILGAGLKGETPSKTLVSRLEAGKAVLDGNKELPVVVSGGQGEGEAIPEAEAMGRYLMENGISGDRIIYEKTSTTTYENLRNSMEVLRQQEMEDPKVLIVTSDYHVVRAEIIAAELGIDTVGHSGISPFVVRVNYFIREYFAIGKMMLDKVLTT
ncbi:hypothetical protein AS034_20155 [[Bacillus] enclensis]|uniref:Uncharacterized SAM-binding protein YcdF, DUF218 family n=1 Tax=[Bacillus] enclensis TaxID=1402860 RepID=A0A0V8H7C4_9BACI|nr:YdcF family protein [[Bacillus] enclensis]KSU58388.1 hypothetical protein AS034_20155 [[Bacillus] enclensis]SCC34831.1 Uncharacterized SAM-binding protein YcdF, DUF218 family [[Bacillus] enclensis]